MSEELQNILEGESLDPTARELAEEYNGEAEMDVIYEGKQTAFDELNDEYQDEVYEKLQPAEDLVLEINEGSYEFVDSEEMYNLAKSSVAGVLLLAHLAQEELSKEGDYREEAKEAGSLEGQQEYHKMANEAAHREQILEEIVDTVSPTVSSAVMKVADERDDVRGMLAEDEDFLQQYPHILEE